MKFSEGLTDRRILICEDEYLVAAFMEDALVAEGAQVLGPVGTVEAALELLWSNVHIDAAIVDLNLQGEMCFPIAEKLTRFRVPFLFCTGSENAIVPGCFTHAPILLKPLEPEDITTTVSALIEKEAMKLAVDL